MSRRILGLISALVLLITIALPGVAAAADLVNITKAVYDDAKQQLRVEATSTDANASLTVTVTSTTTLIGAMRNEGGNKFNNERKPGEVIFQKAS